MNIIHDTTEEYSKVMEHCRNVFSDKAQDYGTSWRIMRPSSITDQIYIKARRIRSIEEKGVSQINEGVEAEFIGIVNYSIIGLMILEINRGADKHTDELTACKAIEMYDEISATIQALLVAKNHDYDEAWRHMRISSFTDIILQKLFRTKEIEDHDGHTLVSEGVEANYMDIVNYAVFALIKIEEKSEHH